jgi:hypothetical protein
MKSIMRGATAFLARLLTHRHRQLLGAAIVLVVPLAIQALAQPATVMVGRFSQNTLSDWRSRSFKGNTKYQLVKDAETGTVVLTATATATASGRYREIKIDLTKTPFLNWSWKVANIFPGIDESVKSGDDFPARIYVVVERGILGSSSLALNYVWASQHALGSEWPSPYTKQVRLVAIDSGQQGLGTWIAHKRNLREDLKKAFGEDITGIDAVAIMTDADDHKGSATASYGDITFSSE